jgi:hypothetical protein
MRLFPLTLLMACGGGGDPSEATAAQALVPEALISSSWQMQVATPDALNKFASMPSWQAYFERDYGTALVAFGNSEGGARVHAELAGLYRQAALIQARAIEETYGEGQLREGDPIEVGYLLGVAKWIEGDAQGVKKHMEDPQIASSTVEGIGSASAAWRMGDFNPIESKLFDSGPVTVGLMISAKEAPHYKLPEQVGNRSVEVSDPTQMISLAEWHEAAALKENAGAGSLLDLWRFSWDEATEGGSLGFDGLFLGPWMSDAEVEFVRAVTLSQGEGAAFDLDSWTDKSAYAAALAPCVSERVDPECILDNAAALQSQVQAAMVAIAGEKGADHQMLANHARVGLIRAAARLAKTLKDERGEGLLRLAALDASDGPAMDPLFQLSMAAWDTKNRNPHRAQALLHEQISRAPGLDAARYSLNVLYLRVSRDAGDGIPMH